MRPSGPFRLAILKAPRLDRRSPVPSSPGLAKKVIRLQAQLTDALVRLRVERRAVEHVESKAVGVPRGRQQFLGLSDVVAEVLGVIAELLRVLGVEPELTVARR
jgi:hypothetical protein